MVLAGLRGVIDYRQARPFEAQWWRHCRVLLTALRDEIGIEVQRASFDFHRSLISNSGLSEESFTRVQRRCSNDFYDLVGVLEPWRGINSANIQQYQLDRSRQEYIAAFGVDPSTQEFKEQEQQDLAKWRADRDAALARAAAPENRMNEQHAQAVSRAQQRRQEYERRLKRRQGR
jgi:Na+-transporting NADH:ubiquinone oxidoreductase subunit NqrC